MRWLTSRLTPPVFDDETKTHRAFMLHVILWALMVVPIPYAIFASLASPKDTVEILVQASVGEVANVFLLYLLRRGHVHQAAAIQVAAFWLFFTVVAATGSGVRGPAYLVGYSLVIVIAGVLLGGRGAAIMTTLAVLAGGGLVYAEAQGLIAPQIGSPVSTWIPSVLLFPVSAILQYLATRRLRLTSARARASEERFRLISSVISDYTFTSRFGPQGELEHTLLGGAFEAITGYTPEEFVAAGGWRATLHPDDVAQDEWDMARLNTNQNVMTEVRTIKKGGEVRWVRVYAHPMWDEAHHRLAGIYGAVQDITAQKQAEAAQQQYAARLEILREIDRAILAARSSEEIALAAVTRIRRLVPSLRASINLFDFQNRRSILLALSINGATQLQAGGHISLEDYGPPIMDQLRQGQPYVIEDVLAAAEASAVDQRLASEGIRAWLLAPLLYQGALIGALNLGRGEPGPFNAEDTAIAQEVADQLAIAIRQARLLAETTETLAREQRLNEVARAISGTLDLSTVLSSIVRLAVELVGADSGVMGLIAPDGQTLTHPYLFNLPEGLGLEQSIPKGQGLAWQVIETGQAIRLADYTARPDALPQWAAAGIFGFIEAPLISGEACLGILGLYSFDRARRFSERDLALAESIGQQAGVAIQNARLFEAEQRRVALLTALHETGLDLSAQLDLPSLLRTIMERATRLLNAPMGGIYLLQADGQTLAPVANLPSEDISAPMQVGEGLVGRVAQSGAPIIVDDYPQWPGRLSNSAAFCAVVSVPIQWQGRVLGVISVCDPRPGRFGSEDVETVRLLAAQAAIAIENAQLYAKLEQRVRERTAELETVNQELESFSYSVSHDLRAPLRGVEGFARILLEDHARELSPEAQHHLHRVRDGIQRMNTLINDLLAFSRTTRQPMNVRRLSTADLTFLVHSLVEELRHSAPDRAVEWQIDRLPACQADPALLKQVLVNLIGNAFKYSRDRNPARIEVGAREQDGQTVYWVRDNGAGFDMRYADKLFGVFQRLHVANEFEGTGVGLAIVQRILQRHGGRIWAEAEVDKGATFYFTLSSEVTHL